MPCEDVLAKSRLQRTFGFNLNEISPLGLCHSLRRKWSTKLAFLKQWWMEISGAFVILSSLIAMVVSLALYHDQPLSQWPYRVSINALVAVFAATLKAAMLLIIAEGISQLKWTWFLQPRSLYHITTFDLSSRSPLGALKLLWILRGRQLVSIGALLTVGAVLIDPFSQQIISYYNCQLQRPSLQATIMRINSYASGVDLSMQKAIDNSLMTPGLTLATNPVLSCPTGNCTFNDVYWTMAICSKCQDITRELVMQCPDGVSKYDKEYYCNTTSPKTSLGLIGRNYSSPVAVLNSTGRDVPIIDMDHFVPASVAMETIMRSVMSDTISIGEQDYGSLHALRCNLFPCLKAFKSEVRVGNLSETLVSTQALPTTDNYPEIDPITLQISCLSEIDKARLKQLGYQFNNTTDWLVFNSSGFRNHQISLPESCMYSYSDEALNSLSLFFRSFFSGSVLEHDVGALGPSILQNLYSDGDSAFATIKTKMANLAESMTAQMRMGDGSANNKPAQGLVYSTETCISIQWGWFTLPIFLGLLTIIFFVLTMYETGNRAKRHNWKSSPLPLLFHGLEPGFRERFGLADQLQEMEEYAKSADVRLTYTEKGWRLVGIIKEIPERDSKLPRTNNSTA